eukprot:CAMPEP_0194365514 /NCGR_PEP_ID=MMETSP0174-20130528/13581_1 /TAXON_ID=216777 /ORGANISM="Proboscia alata, Strain PI-D3" /LENGTH=261 /DNA_ID=CAMNT_0039140261 /DNA_START=47 /DNA_END=832 /DNA_ORIENTATION=-
MQSREEEESKNEAVPFHMIPTELHLRRGIGANIQRIEKQDKLQLPPFYLKKEDELVGDKDDAETENERTILHVKNCTATLTFINDDTSGFENVKGEVLITTTQLCFAAENGSIAHDVGIDVCDVVLFALSSSQPDDNDDMDVSENNVMRQLYCQLNTSGDYDDLPAELYLAPQDSKEADSELQQMFEAMTTSSNLNPENDSEGENVDDNEYGSNDFFWGDDNADGGATQAERDIMLNRLDAVLTVDRNVPMQGQFDDAEET